MFKEILDIKPSTAPAGQIFVQKNLFLKNVKITTKPIAISPTIETVKAEPKYVYGSMYLSATALPPASIPRVTAAIKYLSG